MRDNLFLVKLRDIFCYLGEEQRWRLISMHHIVYVISRSDWLVFLLLALVEYSIPERGNQRYIYIHLKATKRIYCLLCLNRKFQHRRSIVAFSCYFVSLCCMEKHLIVGIEQDSHVKNMATSWIRVQGSYIYIKV